MSAAIPFSLLAPYNEAVVLKADFNDWQETPMQKDDKGVWRCQVELEDGEYRYKFRLQSLSWFNQPGSWVEIVDPWANQVDPEAQAAVLQVRNGQISLGDYQWQADQVELPDPWQTVAYEMHIGEFAADSEGLGTFAKVQERLDYLRDLGINALQLMPVTEFPGQISWGYNPAFPLATESSYGEPAHFKSLVDACHTSGMRMISDMLFNHISPDSPLTQIDHDYWFNREPTDPDFNWGPEYNYDKYDENYERWPAWEFAGQVVDFWLREYHLDGIRYDAVKQLNHPQFLKWISERAQYVSGAKPFFNIAEQIPDDPSLLQANHNLSSCWHDTFCHVIRDALCGNPIDPEEIKNAIDGRRRGYSNSLQLINYLSNHDQPRLLNALLQAGNPPEMALRRYQLGVPILMTAMGIPMLRMGDEWGETRSKPAGEVQPLDWQGLEQPEGQDLYQLHKQLIALRKSHPALQQGELEFIWEADTTLAYLRSFEEDQVLVALNLGEQQLEAQALPVPPGQWQRFESEETQSEQEFQISLEPWSAQIWIKVA